jgi:hypothetical protein
MVRIPHRRFWVDLLGATTIAALLCGTGCNFFKKASPATEADKDKEKDDKREKDGGDKGSQGKGAKTPEEFVQQSTEAEKSIFKSKDVDKIGNAILPFLCKADRAVAVEFLAFMKANRAYRDTLDAKFGKDPTDRDDFDFNPVDKELKSVEIKAKKELDKERVLLTVWRTEVDNGQDRILEKHILLVKEDGVWKAHETGGNGPAHEEERKVGDNKTVKVMVFPGDDQPISQEKREKERKEAVKMKEAVNAQTKLVNEGKYTSRKDARDAYDKALGEVFMEK